VLSVSLFRVFKYSAVLFFLTRHRTRLFRIAAVLLFAAVTSLLYGDVVDFLRIEHPDSVIYALVAKILVVYGALLFVLWQFRPTPEPSEKAAQDAAARSAQDKSITRAEDDRLSRLADITAHDRLRSRYDRLLDRDRDPRS
jgi:hypothetical protein